MSRETLEENNIRFSSMADLPKFDDAREPILIYLMYYNGWVDSRIIHALTYAKNENINKATTGKVK